MKLSNHNMLDGPLLPSIIRFAIPIALTNLIQLLFNAADLIVVAQFCGSVSVASVGATSSLTGLIVNLFMGLSVGAGVTVGQAIGRRNNEDIHRAVHTAIPTALIGGTVLTMVGLLCSKTLLKMMDTPDDVLPLSTIYMQIHFAGIIFNLVYNFSASILRAAGDTKSPLIFLTIAGIVNVILNVIFVALLDMNVAGVSLATTLSQALSAILALWTLTKRTDACKLELKKLRIYKAQLVQILKIGVPAGVQTSLYSVANVLLQSSINSFGSAFMSGYTSSGNILSFINVLSVGFGQASVNFSAQNTGAKKYKRVLKSTLVCIACTITAVTCFSYLVYLLRYPLLSIYISDSQQALEYGAGRIAYVWPLLFLQGWMDVAGGALRGLGKSVLTMIGSILGICVLRIVWILTVFQIPQYHTHECLYFMILLSFAMTFLFQSTFFLLTYCKIRKTQPLSAQ